MMGLAVSELWAIRQDQIQHDREQALASCQQLQQFQGIANSLNTSMSTSNSQFQTTVGHVDSVLEMTQQVSKLAKDNLQNLTGGKSFAYLVPQVASGVVPVPFSIHNDGNNILTGVTISVRKGLIEEDNPSPWGPYDDPTIYVGTLHPQDIRLITMRITPHPGKSGLDIYVFTISAQNFYVDQWMVFRKATNRVPWAYKDNVSRSLIVSQVGNTTNYRNEVMIKHAWSDGSADDDSPRK
jgi:hypothetical protein